MNSQEFVIWLKGFTEGVHDFNITPKQWDLLKERLSEVCEDEEFEETPGMFQVHPQPGYPGVPLGVPNTWQHPHYVDPLDPFRITCNLTGSGTSTVGTIGYLSASYISPNTTTATNLPLGTNVTYTTSGGPTWYSINKIENDSGNK